MFSISTIASQAAPERRAQQRPHVDRESQQVHRRERRDHRQRQRDRRHERGPPVAQEEPHHDHRQDRALVEQHHRAVIALLHRVDEVEGLGEGDLRVALAQRLDPGAHVRGDGHFTRTLRAREFEADHRLAVQQRDCAWLGDRVGDAGDLVQADTAAVRQRDLQPPECLGALHGGERAHGLLGATDVAATAGGVLLHLAQLARHVRRGGVQGEQLRRIEFDPHLARHAAHPRHGADAAHRQHLLGNRVVDEPAQRLVVHPVGGDGVGQDRRAGQVHLLDHRVAQVTRQVRAHAGHRVAHVVHGFLRGLFQAELDRDGDRAVAHQRVDVLDALERGDGVLELAGDLGFELGGGGAGQGGGHHHRRQVDVGEVLDRHRPEAHQAAEREQDEQQDRRDRVADRPGGDVHGLAPATAATTLTRSPSARKPPPCATTCALAFRPPVTSTRSPRRRPTCTLVCCTRLPWTRRKT